jgi:hypothetical protein
MVILKWPRQGLSQASTCLGLLDPISRLFLNLNSCVTTFANHANVTMCIHFGKCPIIKRFATNHFSEKATYQSLDQQASACECYCIIGSCAH